MTSSAKTRVLSDLAGGGTRAEAARAYRRARIKNRLYNFVVAKFLAEESKGLTKAALAKRMGARPEVVGRYLASPGNWTLETISDLLLCISAEELKPESISVASSGVVLEEAARKAAAAAAQDAKLLDNGIIVGGKRYKLTPAE